jgi:hypothetical protein
LQAYLDSQAQARARLVELFPKASCTYFPHEEKYHVFNNYQPVGGFEDTVEIAVEMAIAILTQGANS